MDERQIDQELVERAQQGDTKAFEMLVVKYNRRLGRLLSRFSVHDKNAQSLKGRGLGDK